MSLKPPDQTIVRSAPELTELWRDMMGPGGFARRSLWMIFLDEDGRLSPVVTPIDDLPLEPVALFVRNLAKIVAGVLDDPPGTVAFLLSRPGERAMSDSDCRWARALHDTVAPHLSPWPMHLATYETVRMFTPDDLIAA